MLFYLDKDYLQCLHKVYLQTLYLHKDYFQCLCTFFFFFLFGFYSPFKNILLILHQLFMKGGWKPENPGKNHLTIRKQSLAFPHVTGVRL